MTQKPVVVSPLAHVRSQAESDSVASVPFNRHALRAGTAIASAIRNAVGLSPAQAFVAPPVDGRPSSAEPVAKSPPAVADRAAPHGSPPRLMPTDAGRHVNVMPAHMMAAGGRPMMMKIPGK